MSAGIAGREAIEELLLDNETIVWAGQPIADLIVDGNAVRNYAMGIPALAVLLVLAHDVTIMNAWGAVFYWIPILFLLIALLVYGLFIEPFRMLRAKQRTWFVVTDRRAFEVRFGNRPRFDQRPLNADTIVKVKKQYAQDRAGVWIGVPGELFPDEEDPHFWVRGMAPPLIFHPVRNAERLADLVRRQARAATAEPAKPLPTCSVP